METSKLTKYSVSIVAHNLAPQIADNVSKEFDCVISEPSVWLFPGTTSERGLSFVDKNGKALRSSIFKDLAFFYMENAPTEEKAIESLISSNLFEHYSFEKADIKVIVTKYS